MARRKFVGVELLADNPSFLHRGNKIAGECRQRRG
jgi:hypothetical protein